MLTLKSDYKLDFLRVEMKSRICCHPRTRLEFLNDEFALCMDHLGSNLEFIKAILWIRLEMIYRMRLSL